MAIFSRKPKPSAQPLTPAASARSAHRSPFASADDARVQEVGRDMLDRARKHKTGLLSARFYSDKLMEWSMQDQAFKVQLFRFVDAFPMLKTPDDVFEHLQDYLTQPGVKVPAAIDLGLKAGGIAKGLATKQITSQITGMASKFIAGTDAASALGNLKSLWEDGIAFSVDLLGEACVSEHEAEQYQAKYLDLVNNLPGSVKEWKPNPRLESDHLGPIPRTNVSIKISSLSARVDPIDTEGSITALMTRIIPILETAKSKGVFVNFDMEQRSLKDLTIELFMRCCEKVDFHAGIAMQAYLTSGEDDARRVCEWAKRTGRVITVRLVKGAYWDYEVIHAEQMGWPCPVWRTKRETDACFERMTDIFLDACPHASGGGGVKLALGSHNVRSIAYAVAGLERRGLPPTAIELQMLHGMADQLKHAAAEMNLRVREYVPVGAMIPGMAYLVRRLLENTSNESWLKAGFLDNADPAALLASPHGAPSNGEVKPDLSTIASERHGLSTKDPRVGDGRAFFNEPFRDFSQHAVREAYGAAIRSAGVPEVVNVEGASLVESTVAASTRAFETWRDVDPGARARVLIQTAAAMRSRRDELAGIMVKESGKTWREADADVCEAIDFCEYYARLAVPMFERQRIGKFLGELDELWYQPRGVAVVISPWNFPLAICCGMTVAALVTGNTVIVKPAEQTPGIAQVMCNILSDAIDTLGIFKTPSQVVSFCPGRGETIGAQLVRDPRTAIIAFTGSRDVGLDILSAAAPGSPFGQTRDVTLAWATGPHAQIKKVICEMGGKNALIIDTSADLDEAVLAARHSAFGFQGQKCSACSRLIVVDPAGPNGPAIRGVISRLVEATRALTIGDPARPGTDVGPVIDAEAGDKIRAAIQRAQHDGCTIELAMQPPTSDPFVNANQSRFVGPHIFSGVTPNHALAREEIFGPVLAVMHAPTFEAAIDIANSLPYKLTGGVFSRKPAHIEFAKRRFRVGNLYLNRGITGALVARQPFGGFGMSGVGSKAGGTDYLLQFVEPRASCENTLRRGFAPEL